MRTAMVSGQFAVIDELLDFFRLIHRDKLNHETDPQATRVDPEDHRQGPLRQLR